MKPPLSEKELDKIISQLTKWDTFFQHRKLSREQEVFWEILHASWSFGEILRQKLDK